MSLTFHLQRSRRARLEREKKEAEALAQITKEEAPVKVEDAKPQTKRGKKNADGGADSES